MVLANFMITLSAAFVLCTTFLAVSVWSRQQGHVAGSAILGLVPILWFSTWRMGVWVTPFGTTAWRTPWLLFFCLGLVFAMLLMSQRSSKR